MGFSKVRVTGNVGSDTYSSVSTDPLGPEVGRENRTRMDMHGISDEVGRGETDTDITYLGLLNENGDMTYIYPNAAQNGVLVSATRP